MTLKNFLIRVFLRKSAADFTRLPIFAWQRRRAQRGARFFVAEFLLQPVQCRRRRNTFRASSTNDRHCRLVCESELTTVRRVLAARLPDRARARLTLQ